MPAVPSVPSVPPMDDSPVTCRKCGHEFKAYMYRSITGETVLIDVDNDILFDLVKTCHWCKDVFHWHTNHKQMQITQGAYSDLFEVLESALHGAGKRSEE